MRFPKQQGLRLSPEKRWVQLLRSVGRMSGPPSSISGRMGGPLSSKAGSLQGSLHGLLVEWVRKLAPFMAPFVDSWLDGGPVVS